MTLIKLRKSNETGEEVGVMFVNPDQIISISAGTSATELQMTDGRTRWVKEMPDSSRCAGKSICVGISSFRLRVLVFDCPFESARQPSPQNIVWVAFVPLNCKPATLSGTVSHTAARLNMPGVSDKLCSVLLALGISR